jgi:hypothetical protein
MDSFGGAEGCLRPTSGGRGSRRWAAGGSTGQRLLVEEVRMPEGRCAKCGSSDVIPNVYVHGNADNLNVVMDEKPDAWLFKGEVRSRLQAWVCGACGFTELYAQDPAALLAAYRKHAGQG